MTYPFHLSTRNHLALIILLSTIVLVAPAKLMAQFSAGASGVTYELGRNANFPSLDTIAVFEQINELNDPFISYKYQGSDSSGFYSYTWYKIDANGINTIVHEDINLADSIPSILKFDNENLWQGTYRIQVKNPLMDVSNFCAVVDYSNYPVTLNELKIHDDGEVNGNTFDPCLTAYLEADYAQNEILVYDPVQGNQVLSPRKLFAWTWTDGATTPDYTGQANPAPVAAVFSNSEYTCRISDDFFSQDPNQMEGPEATIDYDAIAVSLQGIKYTVIERPGDNEYIKYEENAAGQLTGSAPLKVDFDANAPSDGVAYYQWKIWHGTDTARAYTTNNTRIRGYEFTTPIPNNGEEESNAADYTVLLVVSSNVCDSSATQEIKLRTSRLEAPNLFVIGFGAQLDYRADYSSIQPDSFRGYIYNRWGRKVYEWSDLTKGWDGRLHGSGAFVSPGAYVVVLRGKGTDGKEYKIRHSLTILREK